MTGFSLLLNTAAAHSDSEGLGQCFIFVSKKKKKKRPITKIGKGWDSNMINLHRTLHHEGKFHILSVFFLNVYLFE